MSGAEWNMKSGFYWAFIGPDGRKSDTLLMREEHPRHLSLIENASWIMIKAHLVSSFPARTLPRPVWKAIKLLLPTRTLKHSTDTTGDHGKFLPRLYYLFFLYPSSYGAIVRANRPRISCRICWEGRKKKPPTHSGQTRMAEQKSSRAWLTIIAPKSRNGSRLHLYALYKKKAARAGGCCV